eukprot:2588972-Prymnesium_polylepis.1
MQTWFGMRCGSADQWDEPVQAPAEVGRQQPRRVATDTGAHGGYLTGVCHGLRACVCVLRVYGAADAN